MGISEKIWALLGFQDKEMQNKKWKIACAIVYLSKRFQKIRVIFQREKGKIILQWIEVHELKYYTLHQTHSCWGYKMNYASAYVGPK